MNELLDKLHASGHGYLGMYAPSAFAIALDEMTGAYHVIGEKPEASAERWLKHLPASITEVTTNPPAVA